MSFRSNIAIVKLAAMSMLLSLFFTTSSHAQKRKKSNPPTAAATMSPEMLDVLKWRELGPFRGGRSAAVTGVPNRPNLFYMGTTGGGIWRTTDGGRQWKNISDGFFGGSIGAIAVSDSDHNVMYAGGGEVTVRGNVSSGHGIWKTEDAGNTWQFKGLDKSRHVSRIRVHPKNSDVVYAAVMGNLYAPNPERGVYKSTDGGNTWRKVLYVNENAGAVDLTFDPNNPRILYASTWRVKRTPYSMESGGEGSALWKSTDSGETWENISGNEGLPDGTWGIVGMTVSPVNSNRVWAIVENEKGGVFRSDDAGKTWKKINESRSLRQRAWYYTRIYADPESEDVVYVLNVQYHKSVDGGKTFKSANAPHGDHHDLWIAPENPKRMIMADDGGGQISYDGGLTWSTYHNQPTAQFYRVTTDDAFPYRIYVAQQDNTTLRINHRSDGMYVTAKDWEPTAGCECGHIAIDPEDQDIVYGGCYLGYLQRLNHRTKQSRVISVYPDNTMGHGAESAKYRFQWNFPLFFSPHDKTKLYTASNHLHVTTNEGQSWNVISPDLTRNDPDKLMSSGGPITQDNTSVEYYCTIFAAAESPLQEGVIWVGSDDGLVHLTKDGGKNWENITPKSMPEWILINSLELSPFDAGTAYLAATMYKTGDFKPYLYKTTDFGKTWTTIVNGIGEEDFTRVIRCDPARQGLLYAGTESGMYVSFDDGKNWQSLQLNLPKVPITDLVVKNNNLVAATQGRSIWLIDDLTPLHGMDNSLSEKDFHLFKPMDSYRMKGVQAKKQSLTQGQNHPGGVMVNYLIKTMRDTPTVELVFSHKDGTEIRRFSNKAEEKKDQLKVKEGANRFVWNMRYPEVEAFDGMIAFWALKAGPKVVPGTYTVELLVDGVSRKADFDILKDKRSETDHAGIQAQFAFLSEINGKVNELHQTVKDIRDIRQQLNNYTERLEKVDKTQSIFDQAALIDSTLTRVEKALYQTQNRSNQDPLNFPIRLNNKLLHLAALIDSGDYPPTDQAVTVKNELVKAVDAELAVFNKVLKQDLPAFNQMIRAAEIDAVMLKR